MDNNTNIIRRTYRVDEVANMLGVARATAYNLIRDGYIRSIRAGRLVLVPVEAVDEFLNPEAGGKPG